MPATKTSVSIPVTGGEINGVRIGLDPHRAGYDRVRLLDEGVPLWAIVASLEGTGNDAAQTASDYNISLEAVQAVQAYYEQHPEYIDAFLLINRSAFHR